MTCLTTAVHVITTFNQHQKLYVNLLNLHYFTVKIQMLLYVVLTSRLKTVSNKYLITFDLSEKLYSNFGTITLNISKAINILKLYLLKCFEFIELKDSTIVDISFFLSICLCVCECGRVIQDNWQEIYVFI